MRSLLHAGECRLLDKHAVAFTQASELVGARHSRPRLIPIRHLDFTHALVDPAYLGHLSEQVEVVVLLAFLVIGLKLRHLDGALSNY